MVMAKTNPLRPSQRFIRFQLRDLFFITVVVAMAIGWRLDQRRAASRSQLYELQIARLQNELSEAIRSHSFPQPEVQSRFATAEEFVSVLDPHVDWYDFQDEMSLFKRSRAAAAAVPLLIERLKDENAEVRTRALSALGVLKQQPEQSVPAIVPHLNEAHSNAAWHSAAALGEFGPDAAPAIEALQAKFYDDNSPIATHAGLMLKKIDPSVELGPRLLALIHSPIRDNRWRAVEALPDHVARGRAEPALSKLFEVEQDKEIRTMIADALNRFPK